MRITAGSHLCGVQPTRLAALTQLLDLGELHPNVGVQLRPHLQRVLEEMDRQDSEFAVQMCILSGDLGVCYDAFPRPPPVAPACRPLPMWTCIAVALQMLPGPL